MNRLKSSLLGLLAALSVAFSANGRIELSAPFELVSESIQPMGPYSLPVAPLFEGRIETLELEMVISRQIFHLVGEQSSTEILNLVWNPLQQAGYSEIFRCHVRTCGGFRFRRSIDVADAPDMFVNLGDYWFLAASRKQEPDRQFVSLLVSRGKLRGFVQVVVLASSREMEPVAQQVTPLVPSQAPVRSVDIGEQLDRMGFAILRGLVFETGSTSLGNEEFAELRELAAYLASNPEINVILVGHTDSMGKLESNVELSAERARSVLKRLVDKHNVSASRLSARGIGYLAPRSTNLTAEGRNLNRRVEVVLVTNN